MYFKSLILLSCTSITLPLTLRLPLYLLRFFLLPPTSSTTNPLSLHLFHSISQTLNDVISFSKTCQPENFCVIVVDGALGHRVPLLNTDGLCSDHQSRDHGQARHQSMFATFFRHKTSLGTKSPSPDPAPGFAIPLDLLLGVVLLRLASQRFHMLLLLCNDAIL